MKKSIDIKQINEIYLKKLHLRFAKNCRYPEVFVDLVWNHCQIVKEIALQLACNPGKKMPQKLDINLIIIGSLIHDIGVYYCYDEVFNPKQKASAYFYHGWIGEKLLRELGFPTKITRFATSHTSTGITIKDIQRENLNLELKDYSPVTLEEELVNYADKFHTKSPGFVTYKQAVEKLVKFDPGRKIKMARLKKKFGLPKLDLLRKKYLPVQIKMENFFSDLNEESKNSL